MFTIEAARDCFDEREGITAVPTVKQPNKSVCLLLVCFDEVPQRCPLFNWITGSPYYRLVEKYLLQEIIFLSFTYHCVLFSFRPYVYIHSQSVVIHEIENF